MKEEWIRLLCEKGLFLIMFNQTRWHLNLIGEPVLSTLLHYYLWGMADDPDISSILISVQNSFLSKWLYGYFHNTLSQSLKGSIVLLLIL